MASLQLSTDLVFRAVCPDLNLPCSAVCSFNAFHVSRDAEASVVNEAASMTAAAQTYQASANLKISLRTIFGGPLDMLRHISCLFTKIRNKCCAAQFGLEISAPAESEVVQIKPTKPSSQPGSQYHC